MLYSLKFTNDDIRVFIHNFDITKYKENNMDKLQKWLKANELEKYAEILHQNDITSVDLLIELS